MYLYYLSDGRTVASAYSWLSNERSYTCLDVSVLRSTVGETYSFLQAVGFMSYS
jgi:hypothetical protein